MQPTLISWWTTNKAVSYTLMRVDLSERGVDLSDPTYSNKTDSSWWKLCKKVKRRSTVAPIMPLIVHRGIQTTSAWVSAVDKVSITYINEERKDQATHGKMCQSCNESRPVPRKHSPGVWTVNNRAVKNSHISPLRSSSWLWVSQQLQQRYTTTRGPVGRRSRAEQTNYTPVRAVAQHCIIPTETPLSHCLALLQQLRGPRTDEPWVLACVARPQGPPLSVDSPLLRRHCC